MTGDDILPDDLAIVHRKIGELCLVPVCDKISDQLGLWVWGNTRRHVVIAVSRRTGWKEALRAALDEE